MAQTSRRKFLQKTSGAFLFAATGCVTNKGPGSSQTTQQPNTTIKTSPQCLTTSTLNDAAMGTPGDGFPTVRVEGDPPPLEHDVHISVQLHRQFTVKSPAEISIHFTNVASVERQFQFSPIVPFTPEEVYHLERDAQLQLIPLGDPTRGEEPEEFSPSNYIPLKPVDSCWQTDRELTFVDYFGHVRLAPCDTVSRRYAIIDHPENDGCLPNGTYRAESVWWIGEALENEQTWGLKLTMKNK